MSAIAATLEQKKNNFGSFFVKYECEKIKIAVVGCRENLFLQRFGICPLFSASITKFMFFFLLLFLIIQKVVIHLFCAERDSFFFFKKLSSCINVNIPTKHFLAKDTTSKCQLSVIARASLTTFF